jgi:glycine/D-amino acid oxidase-like deaminating enzyme
MRPAPGAIAALGYNGRGVAMATAMGRELARAVAGDETRLPIEEGLRRIPFHGFRKLGVASYLVKAKLLDPFGL